MAIRQVGDSLPIIVADEYGRGSKEGKGVVPIAEFRTFWDSLNALGFWQLGDRYSGVVENTGVLGGLLLVNLDDPSKGTMRKRVFFSDPQTCSLEFPRVYNLVDSMSRFAPAKPDSIDDDRG